MNEKVLKFTSQMKKRSGVLFSELKKIESELGFNFPKEYADFLLESNGAEGAIGQAYLVLWSLEKIKPLNQKNEVERHAPHLIIFGSDGGDMAFAFDKHLISLPIVEIAFIDIGLEEPKMLSQTFSEFLEYMYTKWQDLP